MKKLLSDRGISRLTAILLVAVIALALSIIIPYAISFGKEAEAKSCELSLDRANRELAAAYLLSPEDFDEKKARESIADFAYLCPAGGEIYLAPTEGGSHFEIRCRLHSK